jgi:hypothetical protein
MIYMGLLQYLEQFHNCNAIVCLHQMYKEKISFAVSSQPFFNYLLESKHVVYTRSTIPEFRLCLFFMLCVLFFYIVF